MYPCLISADNILQGQALTQQGITVAWELVENKAALLPVFRFRKS